MRAIRVGVPSALEEPWATLFRSADRIWSSVTPHLGTTDMGVVVDDPDVWLWDSYRAMPASDAPMVAVIHEAPGPDEGLAAVLVEHLDRLGREIAERAARVVTGSTASRDSIVARYGVPAHRVDVAPYGVDQSVFRPDGPKAGRAILDAGGDDRPYVLFVGTVLPRKNLPLLRKAVERLPSHQLVLVASPCLDPRSPELLEEAMAPIGGRPVVNIAGVDDPGLAALMRGADVLCLPSLSEGFGLPVAEAMACATPVVVSDRGSLPELVGDGGIVVVPTADAVLAALRQTCADRHVFSERALRRGRQLTWARTAAIMRASVRAVVGVGDG